MKTAQEHQRFRISREQKNYLDELFAKNGGRLSEDIVLGDAKSPKSPLHDLFPWNDKEAGYLYRLRVAARVLRSYAVIRVKPTEAGEIVAVKGPIAIKVSPDGEAPKEWFKTTVVLANDDLSARAIADMISRVRTFQQQLRVFPQLIALCDQLDKVIAAYDVDDHKHDAVAN